MGEIGRACSMNRKKRDVCRILLGKPEGKKQLGRLKCRSVDNTKMDLRDIETGAMDWTDLTQDRHQWKILVNTVMNLRVP
jgi:hypothetical protein